MAKHRTFNADRFLDKFEDHEHLLAAFVAQWTGRIDLKADGLTVDRFKKWLVEGKGDGKDELVEALYQAYDLCTDKGHEDLLAACKDSGYEPDPENSLPVECLSIKVRTERDEIFTFAYDRYQFFRAERFNIYQGRMAKPIAHAERVTKKLNQLLSQAFKDHKGSERVLVRHYVEESYVNFIVYHEKRVKATLTLMGPKDQPKVKATIFRPAQQDFLSYNQETGQLEIEAGFLNEEKKLRHSFGEACFGDDDFFDGLHAADRFGLGVIADKSFELQCPQGTKATLVELRFSLPQYESPKFLVRSKDVLQTLTRNGLRSALDRYSIDRAVVKITFPGDMRGKRVELTGSNSIKFKRSTHAEEIFFLLKEWGIMLSEQDHADADELHDAQAPFVGSTNGLAS